MFGFSVHHQKYLATDILVAVAVKEHGVKMFELLQQISSTFSSQRNSTSVVRNRVTCARMMFKWHFEEGVFTERVQPITVDYIQLRNAQ